MNSINKTICAAAAAILAVTVNAEVPSSITQFTPNMMNYQGHLYDAEHWSDYADGTYDIQCRIYASETGGTALWGGRYSVYVKGGYFNIMLGDSSGSNIGGATYTNNQIWKALWENNDLWLGVTVEQDYMNNPISPSSQREFTPRQRLLAGPYAFRAQAAQYANASYGDFTVGGSLLLGSTWTLGSLLKYDGSALTLGVTDGTTPTSSSPSVDVKAKSISANANGGIDLKSNNGNVSLKVGSSKSITMEGNVGITGATTAVTNLATSVTSVLGISLTGGLGVFVDGGLNGAGSLNWKSNAGNSVKMFKVKTVSLTISSGMYNNAVDINGSGDNNYVWTVAGFEGDVAARTVDCYYYSPRSMWRVEVETPQAVSGNKTFTVHLLGINNACVNDERPEVGM